MCVCIADRSALTVARLAVLWMASLLSLSAATVPSADDCPFVIQTWRMEDGLPENRIRSVVQTQDGYIWVGTFSGLARFDGVSFRLFDTVRTSELSDCAIRTVFQDSRGTLWLGHQNGQLTTYAAGRFTPQPAPATWPNLEVDSFVEDRSGNVWVMNRAGWLAQFKEGHVERLIRPETEHLVNHVHIDTAGQLWRHRDFQAQPLGPDGTPNEVGNQTGVSGRGPMVVCASHTGGIWVADTGLRRWHQSQWAEDRGSLPWLDPGLTALMETKAGDVWVGTYSKGLYVTTRSGKRYQVDTRSGLSHNTVSCLWEDHEGGVWVGTGGGGLDLLRRKRVRMVGPPDNWQDHPVLCVTTNHTGGLWVGTAGAGVYAYNRGEWRNYDDRHGILRRDAWSVH